MKLRLSCGLLVAALSALPAFSQGLPLDGYQVQNVATIGASTWHQLSNGDVVSFDGQAVTRHNSAGTLLQTLHTFPSSNFTGIFVVDPTETFAVVGESTFGDIFRVDLNTGGAVFLTNLFFNYDATIAADGTVYVSAATLGFGADNDIVRLDPLTGATTFVAHVSGASGPLAVDNFGNLYYATVSDSFPPPAGLSSVLVFTAASLAAADCGVPGGCLDETDAVPFATGFDGASDMAYDGRAGALYMVENNFGTGVSRIWHVQAGTSNQSLPFVEEATFNWTSSLQAVPGSGPAQLKAYQPTSDARLLYATSGTGSGRRAVLAKRAVLALSGPGTLASGAVTVDVTGGLPGGFALLFFGPTSLVGAGEVALPIPASVPLISDMDLGSLQFGRALSLDGSGAATTGFNNPGLFGAVSLQGVLVDSTGALLLGTTSRADL